MHGNVVTQLTNITRAEPDPSLFQLPPDSTVTNGRDAPRAKAGKERGEGFLGLVSSGTPFHQNSLQ
jgi:hypothetical protein